MKDVSQETLQAIQSNVKVEETQSLERSVDNLLQASWKDFEIADLQPNLIPNGWDSFVPYGNEGEETRAPLEVFEEGYTKNLIEVKRNWTLGGIVETKEKGTSWENLKYITGNRVVMAETIFIDGEVTVSIYNKDYYYLIVLLDKDDNYLGIQDGFYTWTNSDTTITHTGRIGLSIIRKNNESMTVEESQIAKIKLNTGNVNKTYSLAWEDIPEEDKPVRAWDNMAVHFTPLGNGLTRIQTWGGNSIIKLGHGGSSVPIGVPKVFSAYVEANKFVRFWETWVDANKDDVYPGEKRLVVSVIADNARNIRLTTLKPSDNLDFIASDPQVVEGDKHNPVLVVDQLDDGTEHVRVYGAYPDTKLVYKGGKGFIGENYKLTSNIKNKGVELVINTSIGSSTIPKGDSKLEIEGELQEQDFTIELGARDV